MSEVRDISGLVFGRLTAVSYVEKTKKWLCQCSCGNMCEKSSGNLIVGHAKSCGCIMRDKFRDITGQKFKKLTALSYSAKDYKWNCLCECGNLCLISGGYLIKGSTVSCGCVKKSLISNLIGKTFGRLTVISKDTERTTKRRAFWVCKCSCGNTKTVRGDGLYSGAVQSCGCYNKEIITQYKDLTGTVCGRWTVIAHKNAKKCLCKCECGTIKEIKVQSIKDKSSKSCGCYKIEVATAQLNKRNRQCKINRGLDPDIILSTECERERKRLKPVMSDILKRDKFTCVLCKQVGYKLRVHHIEKFSENINKRADPKNLITLCEECHKKAHDYNFNNGLNLEIQEKLFKLMEEILLIS